jgi:hypothetical protein
MFNGVQAVAGSLKVTYDFAANPNTITVDTMGDGVLLATRASTPQTIPAPTPAPTSQPGTIGTTYAGIAGNYQAGTADGGTLYIRSDGASRFSAPDPVACPTCTTASAPVATLDFNLNTLTSTGPGSYQATGIFTATSDPAWAQQQSSPATVGGSVSLTDNNGTVTLSFLPSNDTLSTS